jgi:hypothetical protein
MPQEQPPIHDTPTQEIAGPAPQADVYEPLDDQDDWLDDAEELPRRPRRRLLSPVPLALIGILLILCGFIGGVLVEKGQTSSSSSTGAGAGLASRFAALRGGGTGTTGSSGAGAFAPGAGATAGSVSFLSGSTLYVTNSEGNTVKVDTSPGTTVTKTVKAEVKGIRPGETVTVTGPTGASGAVTAESIRVGAGGGGGLAALFGGAGSSPRGGSSSSKSGEPALFGSGG